MDFQEQEIEKILKEKKVVPQVGAQLLEFYRNVVAAAKKGHGGNPPPGLARTLAELLKCFFQNIENPYQFSPYHQALRTPFDYREFGVRFFGMLVDKKRSALLHRDSFRQAEQQLERGENVFLLANHQSEADPQLLYWLLKEEFPLLAERITFVAGHRVTTDPLAVPFSMGCNLICIYSKKYIELEPEHKVERTLHNQKAMGQMRELLDRGGACIYIAPSGGRDRPDPSGRVVPDFFDPSSLEMSFLQGKRAAVKTHFYPLTLLTYEVLPAAQAVQKELGEPRVVGFAPVFAALGKEIDPTEDSEATTSDRKERREQRARRIWEEVMCDYEQLERLREG
jgi:glycerol-3-phosphate O-acyltransferase